MARVARARAVVTGAGSGIGRAVVRRLLREGMHVLAVDIDEDGLEAVRDDGVELCVANLSDLADRAAVIDAGRGCDYLVNAAGILRARPLLDFTVDDWREIMAINAEAVFFLCQGIGPSMPPGGAIVNLSSSSAKLATTVEVGIYAASKAAILSITRSFAYELAPIPVRVNAICPGIVDTPMQDKVITDISPLRDMSDAVFQSARLDSVPLRRAVSADECAGVIWFLLSPEAGYMTGQAINHSGGSVTW